MENDDGLASPLPGALLEDGSPRQSDMIPPSPEERGVLYGQLAGELWQVNKNRSELMNDMAAKLKRLPPVVLSLPEVPAFLVQVQKLAFFLGVAATMKFIEHAQSLDVERTQSDVPPEPPEAKR